MSKGIYDLDDSKSKLQLISQMLELKLDIAVLKDLLSKHNIIDSYEFDAARAYLATTPEFKEMKAYLDKLQTQIEYYQNNPQAYLQEIMRQKLNGNL